MKHKNLHKKMSDEKFIAFWINYLAGTIASLHLAVDGFEGMDYDQLTEALCHHHGWEAEKARAFVNALQNLTEGK